MFPFLLVLAAAFLFGLSTPLSKGLLSHWTPEQLAGLLYLGAALGAALPMLRKGKAAFLLRADRANMLRLSGAILFGGILGPLFLLLGLKYASASSVSLWLNLEMVATALLGVLLFKDHLGRLGLLGAVCVLCAGLVLSWGEGAAGARAGIYLGIACLCWGIDNNLTSLIDGLRPVQSTFWKGLVAGGVNLGIGLFSQNHTGSVSTVFPALLTGALCYGASMVLYVTAAQNLGATRSQMIFASAPLFGLVGSFFFLREPLTLYHGTALLFQALGIFFLFRDKHGHPHSHAPMDHTHSHRHNDGHHGHTHEGRPEGVRHSHTHAHQPMTHSHPHWPDIHHRHLHGRDG